VRTRYLGKTLRLPEGAIDKGTYRRLMKHLKELRKERERILKRIEWALEVLW